MAAASNDRIRSMDIPIIVTVFGMETDRKLAPQACHRTP